MTAIQTQTSPPTTLRLMLGTALALVSSIAIMLLIAKHDRRLTTSVEEGMAFVLPIIGMLLGLMLVLALKRRFVMVGVLIMFILGGAGAEIGALLELAEPWQVVPYVAVFDLTFLVGLLLVCVSWDWRGSMGAGGGMTGTLRR